MYVTSIRMWNSSAQKITATNSTFVSASLSYTVEVKPLLISLKIFLTFGIKTLNDSYNIASGLELNLFFFFNSKGYGLIPIKCFYRCLLIHSRQNYESNFFEIFLYLDIRLFFIDD